MTHFDITETHNIFTIDNLKGGYSVILEAVPFSGQGWTASLMINGGVAYTSPVDESRRRWADRLTVSQDHLTTTQREALLDGLMALA